MVEKKVLLFDGKEYALNLFVERRRSVRASIVKGGVNIRIPKMLSVAKQRAEVENLVRWAVNKIRSSQSREVLGKKYCHLDTLEVMGKVYVLDIVYKVSEKSFTRVKGNRIEFKIAGHHSEEVRQCYISKQLKKILAREHLKEVRERVNFLNEIHFRKELKDVSLKHTISRWGCCSARGELNFSTRLLLAPREVIDYVIIHELAHLIELNHSRRFWDLVRRADPNYKDKVKWLKNHGYKLVI